MSATNISSVKFLTSLGVSFVLGSVFTFAFLNTIQPKYKSYNFSSVESQVILMKMLDEKGIMYSYEIDHLKRTWITPIVKDELTVEIFIKELEIGDLAQEAY